MIGKWSGMPLRIFLERVGTDTSARYVGFKNPEFVTAIYVTNDQPRGYWTDRGYNWFSGI